MLSLPCLSIKGCQKLCRAHTTCCSLSDTAGNEVESSFSALTASLCVHDGCPVKNKLCVFVLRCLQSLPLSLCCKISASVIRAGCGEKSSLGVEAHCSNPVCAEYHMMTAASYSEIVNTCTVTDYCNTATISPSPICLVYDVGTIQILL